MANHNLPLISSAYVDFVTELRDRFVDITLGLDPSVTSPTNLPTNAIRWSSASFKWQKWNGSTWSDLSSYYNISINGTVGATTPYDGTFLVNTSDVLKLRSNQSAPSSTDAFIYRPANDTLAFGTGSVDRMRLNSSGHLLLGYGEASTVIRHILNGGTSSGTGASTTYQKAGVTVGIIGDHGAVFGGTSNDLAVSAANNIVVTANGGSTKFTNNVQIEAGLSVGNALRSWETGSKVIEVSTSGNIYANTSGEMNVGANFREYVDGTYKYTLGNAPCLYRQVNGEHAWYSAPTGTIDNDISWTQAMKLTSSQLDVTNSLKVYNNVGVGTNIGNWSANNIRAVQVQNGSFANNGGTTVILSNATLTDGGAYNSRYIISGASQYIALNRTGADDIQFLVAPAGNAGDIITWQHLMTLDTGAITALRNLRLGTNELQFDQTGVRSWSLKATGGNLQLDSGDALGALKVNNNLGLGTMPRTTSNAKVLETSLTTFGMDHAGSAIICFNAYQGSGNIWNYKQSGEEATLFALVNDGSYRWYHAASGTADTPIPLTEAMQLDLNGNLSVSGGSITGKTLVINTSGQSHSINTYYGANSEGNNIFIGGGGGSSVGAVGETYKGAYNTATGVQALLSNTTGYHNVAVGYHALVSNTTGYQNVAVGLQALTSNTAGTRNSSVGHQALYSNTTGSDSTAVGYRALYNNTAGASTAVGVEALFSNTSGTNNTAVGYQALTASNGSYNTAMGHQSLLSNTTGSENVAYGGATLHDNTTGVENTAVGYHALYKNTTAAYNSAVGHAALYSNTTGARNTATGYQALYSNTTSSYNTASGYRAMYLNTTGASNSATGYHALYSNTTGNNNVAMGLEALYTNSTGSYNTAMGHSALFSNTTGFENTAIGYSTLLNNTTGNYNTAMGVYALRANTGGINNTAIGYSALYTNTTGSYNTAIGRHALQYSTSANDNTAVGYLCLSSTTTGYENVAVGTQAGYLGTTAYRNTSLGYKALYSLAAGYSNVAIGRQALNLATGGNENVAIGQNALGGGDVTASGNTGIGTAAAFSLTTGTANTAVGYAALYSITSGYEHVAIGNQAMYYMSTGNQCTALGDGALMLLQNGSSMTSGTNSTGVGNNARVSGDNQVQLGDSGTTTYVYGTVQNRSDLRDKADVRPVSLGLEFIRSLNPVDYKWDMREDYLVDDGTGTGMVQLPKDGSKKRSRYHHGFIAQEVQSLTSEFGGLQDHSLNGGCDVLSIGYDEFIAPLVKSVQELDQENKHLKIQLKLLMEKVETLLNK